MKLDRNAKKTNHTKLRCKCDKDDLPKNDQNEIPTCCERPLVSTLEYCH